MVQGKSHNQSYVVQGKSHNQSYVADKSESAAFQRTLSQKSGYKLKDFIQKGIAKQTNVENKNSIGLKAVSFLVQNDEIYKSVGKLLTKALFNAILLIVYNYVLRNFLPHNFDYVDFLFLL